MAQKIFEDKEFHGAVKFFKDVFYNSVAGVVKMKRLLLYNGDLTLAESKFTTETFLALKTTQDWLAGVSFQSLIDGTGFTGSTQILAAYFEAALSISSGTQNWDISACNNVVRATLSGTADYGSLGALVCVNNIIATVSDNGTLPNAFGTRTKVSPETGASDTWTDTFLAWVGFNQFADGTITLTNVYGFYSNLDTKHANTTITNGWHFYGLGDFPSFFGGDVLIAATGKLMLDGLVAGDTYIVESAANVIDIVAGGVIGAKVYGKGLQTLEASTYTADNGGEATSVIPAGANNVNVLGVANDANDWMLLPTALLGMRLIIYCNAGANFELRTPAGSDETINGVNADGDTLEYLCTDTESIALTCVSNGKWIAVGYSALGAIVTAVVPD